MDAALFFVSRTAKARQMKEKLKVIRENKVPPFKNGQNLIAAIPDLREAHSSFVRSIVSDLNGLNVYCQLLEVHEDCYAIRNSADPDFTDKGWRPMLPGDMIPLREVRPSASELSGLMWPPLVETNFSS